MYFGFLSRILIFSRFFRKLTCFYDKDGSIDAGPNLWSFFLRSLWSKYSNLSKKGPFFWKNDFCIFDRSRNFFSYFWELQSIQNSRKHGGRNQKKNYTTSKKREKSEKRFFGRVRPSVRSLRKKSIRPIFFLNTPFESSHEYNETDVGDFWYFFSLTRNFRIGEFLHRNWRKRLPYMATG